MLKGNMGLEKESLRVDCGGFLSHTKHPFLDNPNMERDFCENQTELITNVCDSAEAVWNELASLHKKAVAALWQLPSGKEVLWPFSNPPYVKGEADIPIAHYQGQLKGKEQYRQYLADKYGKKKMLFSGIHFNFSFSEEVLREGYKESGAASFREYKDSVYLELAKKAVRASWLLVYLMAASPVMDGSYFQEKFLGKDVLKNYASPRCGEIGYWNDFIPLLDYENLDTYIDSIQTYVDEGQLKAVSELYYPVRLKPAGENSLENLKMSGVNHIELRMLDLNPLSPVGIMKEDVWFLQLLLVYLSAMEDEGFETFEQIMAVKNEKRAAQYYYNDIWIETGWMKAVPVQEAALEILLRMERFYEDFYENIYENGSKSRGIGIYHNMPPKQELLDMIQYQKKKVLHPNQRYAAVIRQQFRHGYVEKGIQLAEKYASEIAASQQDSYTNRNDGEGK